MRSAARLALRGLAAAALAGGGAAQVETIEPERRAVHLRCVRGERTLAFLEAWQAAGQGRRDLVLDLLEGGRRPRSGLLAPPALPLLDRARRVLLGEVEAASAEAGADEVAARLVESLDLRVVPGLFAARREGLGEAMTVHVEPLYPADARCDLHLSLHWISPDGERIRARTEPVAASAFRQPFAMYIRPPASEPGTWRLVAEGQREDSVARGLPVAVECVREPAGRMEALREQVGERAGEERVLLEALEELRGAGLRTFVASTPARQLQMLEGAPDRSGVPRSLPGAWQGSDGIARILWRLDPEPAARTERILLCLVPSHQPADLLLGGVLGRAWREAASRGGWTVLTGHLPRNRGGEAPLARLQRVLGEDDRYREARADLVCVASGTAVAELQLQMIGVAEPPFGRVVLSALTATSTPARFFDGLPRLLVAPVGDPAWRVWAEGRAPQGYSWMEGQKVLVLNELSLPDYLLEWL